jgi:hypothetical protein
MHNDEPTLSDALHRDDLVQEVGEAIAHCDPPQVFGVHGDWGLGKTSFLHQVQWYLTGECPQLSETATRAASDERGKHRDAIVTVWFDAWRYQNEEPPVVALLHEIRTQLSWADRARRSTSKNTKVLVRGALLSMEELTKRIGFQYSKFQQAKRDWESDNMSSPLPSYTLRDLLHKAIDELLPNRGRARRRLVVFVDDLDRCEPESAYRLLEGLKVYLTLENCVFVLGMNQRAIEEAIGSRMQSDNRQQRAAEYLEKLCQNIWRLPMVRKPVDMLGDLLINTVTDGDVHACITSALRTFHQPCLPPNPRRLKGLANLIGRLAARFSPSVWEEDERMKIREVAILVVVAYVYQFHQEIYLRWDADSGMYRKLWELCNGNPDRDLDDLFTSIKLPQRRLRADVDERYPTADGESTQGIESTYQDPTRAGVFWIQPLILQLGDDADPQLFERYLHGVSS